VKAAQPDRLNSSLLLIVLLASLSACASNPQRAAPSLLACMQKVRDAVPQEFPAPLKHCLAAGGIAMQCSVTESRLAGWGKELQDLFSSGDADRADLRANAEGRRCANGATNASELVQCCQAALP
jgi:hypothetical protein